MDALVELFAAIVVALAAAAFSQFGVDLEQPQQARTEEARTVRRSPVAVTEPAAKADCPERQTMHV